MNGNTQSVRAVRPRPRLRGFAAVAALVCLCACTPGGAAAVEDWSPQVREALELYRADDFGGAQRLCRALLAENAAPAARRDAAAIQALIALRQPSRHERQAGLNALLQLAAAAPELCDRPECLLALGIARRELGETAESLQLLDLAATSFAARNEPARQALALAELAATWSRHGEWARTPPALGVRAPEGAAEAVQARREQLGRIRTRLEAVPGSDDALARVDLLLARDFIVAGDRVEDGLRVLAQIAAAPRLTPAVIDAAFFYAEHLEQVERWPAALAVYERLAAAAPPVAAERAAQRRAALLEPRIALDLPERVPAGAPLRIGLRARNIAAVHVEVRQVALAGWLASRRGQLAEALLPLSGSVQLERDLRTATDGPHEWWDAASLPQPLECSAPPGAYVVLATAADQDARPPAASSRAAPIAVKRLVLISDLAATLIVGPERALVWAESADATAAGSSAAPIRIRFWMRNSFVPVELELSDRFAAFDLPPEARLLRDRRWTCLLEAGPHLALCAGQLLPGDAGRTPTAVALLGAPSAPRVGETLQLVGCVLPGGEADPLAGSWSLDVRDEMDEQLWAGTLAPDPDGLFAIELPVLPAMAKRALRFVVRRNGQALPNVRGRFGASVSDSAAATPLVDLDLPTHLPPDKGELRGKLTATYRWGLPLAHTHGQLVAEAVDLPVPDLGLPQQVHPPREGHLDLDNRGQADIDAPVERLRGDQPTPAPRALGLWFVLSGWEGVATRVRHELLLADQPAYGWIELEPAQPVVGKTLRFLPNWFDPGAGPTTERPTLVIERDGSRLAEITLYYGLQGLSSAPWTPSAPGGYAAILTVPRAGGAMTVRRNFAVLPEQTVAGENGRPVRCTARYEDGERGPAVQVALSGEHSGPLLVVLAGDDPVTAARIADPGGTRELVIPLETRPTLPLSARVVAFDAGGAVTLAESGVEPAAPQAPLRVTLSDEAPRPGQNFSVTLAAADQLSAPVILRLVRDIDARQIQWLPGEMREVGRLLSPGPSVIGTFGRGPGFHGRGDTASGEPSNEPAVEAAGPARERPLSPVLVEGLFAGTTLWTGVARTADSPVELQVPAPDQPGLYQLWATAVLHDGSTQTAVCPIDTRQALRLQLDWPPPLTLGDRVLVGLAIENPGSTDVTTLLRISTDAPAPAAAPSAPPGRLTLESVEVGQARHSAGALGRDGWPVRLPAGERTWVRMWVEAAGVGTGTLRVEAESDFGRQSAGVLFEVRDDSRAAKSTEAPLRVRRTVFQLRRLDRHGSGEDHGRAGELGEGVEDEAQLGAPEPPVTKVSPAWESGTFDAGRPLAPGEELLIRDEIELDRPLVNVRWGQRVPSNCFAAQSEQASEDRSLRRTSLTVGRTEHHAPALPVGRHYNETHIVAVRPGVCRVPPPELWVENAAVPVLLEPAETVLRVLDPLPARD